MTFTFGKNLRTLLAFGLLGCSTTVGQAFDARRPEPAGVYEFLSDEPVVRGQDCSGGAVCDVGCDQDGCSDCDAYCDCHGNWLDNTVVWMAADAYKSLGDSGLAGFAPLPFALGDSAGLVTGFNTGIGLGDSLVRAQVGASYGAYDFKGRTSTTSTNSIEQQTYLTFGLYKRSDVGNGDAISWGVVHDSFFGHQWGWATNSIFLGQLRAISGLALNEWNEVGMWGTFHTQDDNAQFAFPAGTTPIRAMNQANGYWRHNFDFGASSMFYLGVVDNADVASWLFGTLATAPLNDNTALNANFTYVAPGSATGLVGASEEQWNLSLGFVFYFGGKSVSPDVSGDGGLPLLPVANNGSFLITN